VSELSGRMDLLEGGVQVARSHLRVVDGRLEDGVHREAVGAHVAA
jgi:hypothetical protein